MSENQTILDAVIKQPCSKFTFVQNIYQTTTAALNTAGQWIAFLPLRLILAWEFWESGLEKYHGANWFVDIKDHFPFPFNLVPPEISWHMATWSELLLPWLLVFGLFTRFATVSLIVLTIVAIAAVHWPAEWHTLSQLWQGYALSDKGAGNYKLPLLYIIMMLPLLLCGAGKLSLDHWIQSKFAKFCTK